MRAISPISGASLNTITKLRFDAGGAEVACHAARLVELIDARAPKVRYAKTCKKSPTQIRPAR